MYKNKTIKYLHIFKKFIRYKNQQIKYMIQQSQNSWHLLPIEEVMTRNNK